MFQGSIPALITPFTDNRVDEAAFKSLIYRQIEEGSSALVPCGTTGESPTLNHDEHMAVTELCIEAAAGRVPVIAGAGSNSTDEAVMLACHAAEAGASAVLVVMPYYNKPTPEGQYLHFKAVHDAAGLPIIIYNIPGRSTVDMSVQTMARRPGACSRLPTTVRPRRRCSKPRRLTISISTATTRKRPGARCAPALPARVRPGTSGFRPARRHRCRNVQGLT